MNEQKFSWRKLVRAALVMVLAAVVITGCKKDNGTPVRIPSAGLLVFNLAPDQPALGVALSGRAIANRPLEYTSYNGFYQNIFTGSRDIDAYDYRSDSTLSHSNFEFRDSSLYSLFVIGNKGVYRTVTVRDDVDSTNGDHAYLRYINAVPDSAAPVVSVTAGGSTVSEDAAAFGTVSGFKAVNPGDVTLSLKGGNIAASRTFPLEKGKVYTALLVGDPAATDTLTKVQIRYVVNGTVSSSNGE